MRWKKAMGWMVTGLLTVALAGCGGSGSAGGGDNGGSSGGESGSSANSGEVITINIADHLNQGHLMYETVLDTFIPELEKSGKIKVEYYPGQQLGKTEDMFDLVLSGVAHIGYVYAGVVEGHIPLTTVFSLPGEFENATEAKEVYQEMVKGVLASEYDKLGIVPIAVTATDPYEFFTADKQVKLPEDLAGLKLRTAGGTADEVLEQLGASVVSMTPAELYEALQRGVLDGATYSFATAMSHHLEEVTKYATDGVQLGSAALFYFMSKEKFESFSPEIQQIILEAGAKFSDAVAQRYDEFAKQNQQKYAEAGGTIYTLTEEDKKAWEEALKPAAELWIQKMESKGNANAREVYEEMQRVKEQVRAAQ